jgi:hypothetical protein
MVQSKKLTFVGLALICLIGCTVCQSRSDDDDDDDDNTDVTTMNNDMTNSSDYSLGDTSNTPMNLRTSSMKISSSSMNSIPLGNYQLLVVGSSLPPVDAMFDSTNFQFSGCNTISVPWTISANGIFQAGSIKTHTKNKCKSDNDQKYLQAILGGNGYAKNGKNFYLTKNGKNIISFSPLSSNNVGGGGIIFSSNPQTSSPGYTVIPTINQQMRPPMNNPPVIVMPSPPQPQSNPNPQIIYMPAPPQPTPPPQIIYVPTPPQQTNSNPQIIYAPAPPQANPPSGGIKHATSGKIEKSS